MQVTEEMRDRRYKLTDQQVKEVRELRAKGATLRGIARKYGVSKELVYLITSGKRRANI
jgi:transcriptional regulator